jgi:hypothetical protein
MSYTLETHMKYNENLTYEHYIGKENENKDIQKCTGNYNQLCRGGSLESVMQRGRKP